MIHNTLQTGFVNPLNFTRCVFTLNVRGYATIPGPEAQIDKYNLKNNLSINETIKTNLYCHYKTTTFFNC